MGGEGADGYAGWRTCRSLVTRLPSRGCLGAWVLRARDALKTGRHRFAGALQGVISSAATLPRGAAIVWTRGRCAVEL